MRDLTRRFFHQLVRQGQLVKGFQLAVDIGDYDLFMDIHHAAVRRGVPDLAHAALIKARAGWGGAGSEGGPSPAPPLFTELHPVKPATFHKGPTATSMIFLC